MLNFYKALQLRGNSGLRQQDVRKRRRTAQRLCVTKVTGLQYYLLVLRDLHFNSTVLWGPFLERPGNFSGMKVNFNCWIVAQFLAHKPVKNYWNFVRKCKHGKHKTAFRARNLTWTFEKRAPGLLQKDLLKEGDAWRNFFFKHYYCHACQTRFALFFLLPSYCISLPINKTQTWFFVT